MIHWQICCFACRFTRSGEGVSLSVTPGSGFRTVMHLILIKPANERELIAVDWEECTFNAKTVAGSLQFEG